jgi:glycosyltransferase involved in cell wall biosynthesis
MKIALVTDAIYPYNKGGKETRTFQLSTRLAKKGHDVHIYTMNWWNGKKENKIKKENGVTLHGITKLYPLYSGKRRSIKEAILFSLGCFKLLKEDFDVIDVDHMPHLAIFPAKIITIIKRKKLIVTWNEVWGREYWVEYMGKLGNIAYLIELLSARMPDEIIAVSEHTKKKLKKDLGIKTKIFVVTNGVDLTTIKNIKPSKQKSDIIFAGRLLSHKNINLLITAIHILKNSYPNITCVIVGKGPEEKKLKKLVTVLNLQNNITFYDFLENHNDLYALMKSSKVFAFPSTREGFGLVAIEANASGLPVITIDHKDNATKDLIKNGQNGEKIRLIDKDLAVTINHYLSDDKDHQLVSKYSKNYDWEKIANKLEEAYKK